MLCMEFYTLAAAALAAASSGGISRGFMGRVHVPCILHKKVAILLQSGAKTMCNDSEDNTHRPLSSFVEIKFN